MIVDGDKPDRAAPSAWLAFRPTADAMDKLRPTAEIMARLTGNAQMTTGLDTSDDSAWT